MFKDVVSLSYRFSPEVERGMRKGIYEIVRRSDGTLLTMARCIKTGCIVAHAQNILVDENSAIKKIVGHLPGVVTGNPFGLLSALIETGSMWQNHCGFQKTYEKLDVGFNETYRRLDVIQGGLRSLQQSVGILQGTTSLIGLGTIAGVALSAVNLHQTLKLRDDVKHLRLEVKDGFIDLKQALKGSEAAILERIDQVAQDVEFKSHRTILAQAYGRFSQALVCLNNALRLPDASLRNTGISNAQMMLFNALADYDNPLLLEKTCSAGQLRRQECVWAIDQAITQTYDFQGAYAVVSDRLTQLQNKIRQDSLKIIDNCQSEDELDFLFPEITRIQWHDLAAIATWQNHADWLQELSPTERDRLVEMPSLEANSENVEPNSVAAEPQEQLLYTALKPKSHFLALRDQLKIIVKPDLRQSYETFISQQAPQFGHTAIATSNLQEAPDLAVTNLYWYFKNK